MSGPVSPYLCVVCNIFPVHTMPLDTTCTCIHGCVSIFRRLLNFIRSKKIDSAHWRFYPRAATTLTCHLSPPPSLTTPASALTTSLQTHETGFGCTAAGIITYYARVGNGSSCYCYRYVDGGNDGRGSGADAWVQIRSHGESYLDGVARASTPPLHNPLHFTRQLPGSTLL